MRKCVSFYYHCFLIAGPSFKSQFLSKALPWHCYASPVVPQAHRWCEEPGGKKADLKTCGAKNQTNQTSSTSAGVQFCWIFVLLPYLFLFFPSGWDIQNPGKYRQVLASKVASISRCFFSCWKVKISKIDGKTSPGLRVGSCNSDLTHRSGRRWSSPSSTEGSPVTREWLLLCYASKHHCSKSTSL